MELPSADVGESTVNRSMRNKITNVLLCLVLALATVTASGAQEAGALAFGDSLTKGFGDFGIGCTGPEQGGFPPRLELRLIQEGWQVKMMSAGLCGERTDEGVSRLPSVLNASEHDAVILMEGTNDIVQGVSIETSLFNLRFMADTARARGVQPIYSSVIPIRRAGFSETALIFRDQLRGLANQQGAVFADAFETMANVPNLFTEQYLDDFHPIPSGYGFLAEAFVQPVATALGREGFLELGNVHYCRDFGPCTHGQGDCDSDDDCVAGARCVNDTGEEFGYRPNIDVCLADNVVNCTLLGGEPNFCSVCGPCNDGQGDCDGDDECLFGTNCTDNVGADFGFAPGADVCLRDTPATGPDPDPTPTPCTLPPGDRDLCKECGPCGEGEGDCDNDGQCGEGLFCANNTGPQFGFGPNIDICMSVEPGDCPLPNGHPHFCRECGPCEAGQGDCDGLDECVAGAFCASNNGAEFGFSPNIDVCVSQ